MGVAVCALRTRPSAGAKGMGDPKGSQGKLSAMSAGVRRLGEWLPHRTDGCSQPSEEWWLGQK